MADFTEELNWGRGAQDSYELTQVDPTTTHEQLPYFQVAGACEVHSVTDFSTLDTRISEKKKKKPSFQGEVFKEKYIDWLYFPFQKWDKKKSQLVLE